VPRIEVYNKIDVLLNCEAHCERNAEGAISDVWISAQKKLGLDFLLQAIAEHLGQGFISGDLALKTEEARIRALLYELNVVEHAREVSEEQGGWLLKIKLPRQKWLRICQENPGLEQALTNTKMS
jgi:GTP-binding protein HflX